MAVSSLPLLGSTPPSASGVAGASGAAGASGVAGASGAAGASRLAPLQGLCPDELVELAPGIELAEARKLISHAHRVGALPERSPCEVRRVAFDRVRAVTHVPSLTLRERVPSALDPFVKYVIETPAGGLIEAVKIPLENPARVSVCVSSQVGCGLGCTFCATGRMGLVRNLEAWEIIEQVRIVRRDLPAGVRVHGVVFQGMGEPLSNWNEVKQAARVLSEPCAQAIDARNITISTSGLPTGIRALSAALPNVRLALSIGSALPGDRAALIPIDAVHPLEKVVAAVGEHTLATGYAPLFAYTLLAGKNDTSEHAFALAALAQRFTDRYQKRPRISVIPYNAIGDDDPFQRVDEAGEERFREALRQAGFVGKRRYSGGSDVGAACGQLALRGSPRS